MTERPLTGPIVVGSLASRFSGLQAQAEDLRLAHRFLDLLAARPSIDAPDVEDLIAIALWNAAVVSYGRCFNSGRHRGFVGLVEIPQALRDLHRWVLDLRNEYVAHLDRQTPLQQDTAFLDLEDTGDGVALRVGTAWMRAAHPDRVQIERVRDLALTTHTLFGEAAADAGRLLREAVGNRYSLPELLQAAAANTPIRIDIPD